MKDRISEIMRSEEMNSGKFAEEIGVQASSISHIMSGRNNPSLDIVSKILERFRGVNAEWLLMGKGNMYKTQNGASKEVIETPLNLFDNTTELLDNKIDESIINSSDASILKSNTIVSSNDLYNSILPTTNNKKIEKIIIFYADKSFDIYEEN